MMDKYQKIKNDFENGEEKFSKGLRQMSSAVGEIKDQSERVSADIKNVSIIISDIDKQFSEKTGIFNVKDMDFLWGAVALQCTRWILIPTFDIETLTPSTSDRKDSSIEGKKDRTASGKKLDMLREENVDQKYPDNKQIILLPVPYDAMKGTEDIVIPGVTEYGKQLYSMNHHSATLGHDPFVGQVIGTTNILTRSITFHDAFLTTRKVENPSGRTQIVVKVPVYSLPLMLKGSFESLREDKTRIVSALLKENLHLQSDKYTKTGLPIPLLSADMQQMLIDNKWNSKELEDIAIGGIKGIETNFMAATIINTIVGTLHGFCYNEIEDESRNLYSVRTRRVVATSNIIAESLNLAAVLGGTLVGVFSENPELIKKSISHLDIGGIIEAIHQVFKGEKLHEEMRREFLEQELYNRFTNNKYSFLEESGYEEK